MKPTDEMFKAAQQATFNGVQVVRIPVGYNAALYFTKENDSLKVYAYKWIYQNLDAEKYTGYIDSYNFQTQNLTRLTYANGILNNTLPLAHYTKQAVNVSSDGKLKANAECVITIIFDAIWDWITNFFSGVGTGGGGDFASYMNSYGYSASDYSGYGFTTDGGGSGGGGATWGPPPCPPSAQGGASINLKINNLKVNKEDPHGSTGGCSVNNNSQWSEYLMLIDPAIDDPNFTLSNYLNVNVINYNLANMPEQPLYTDDSPDDYTGYEFDPNVDADFIDVKIDTTFSSNTKVNAIYNKLKIQHTLQKMLTRFFGKHNPINLEFKVENLNDPNNPNKLAETRPIGWSTNPYTDRIVIVIDGTKAATRPDLMVAKTIIHEVIHAQMFRYIKLNELGILPSEYHKMLTAMATYLRTFPKANPKLISKIGITVIW